MPKSRSLFAAAVWRCSATASLKWCRSPGMNLCILTTSKTWSANTWNVRNSISTKISVCRPSFYDKGVCRWLMGHVTNGSVNGFSSFITIYWNVMTVSDLELIWLFRCSDQRISGSIPSRLLPTSSASRSVHRTTRHPPPDHLLARWRCHLDGCCAAVQVRMHQPHHQRGGDRGDTSTWRPRRNHHWRSARWTAGRSAPADRRRRGALPESAGVGRRLSTSADSDAGQRCRGEAAPQEEVDESPIRGTDFLSASHEGVA